MPCEHLHGFRLRLERADRAVLLVSPQHAEDIIDLGFEARERGAVPGGAEGPEEGEVVGQIWVGETEVGFLGGRFAPGLRGR